MPDTLIDALVSVQSAFEEMQAENDRLRRKLQIAQSVIDKMRGEGVGPEFAASFRSYWPFSAEDTARLFGNQSRGKDA